jgi:hypothetical protein
MRPTAVGVVTKVGPWSVADTVTRLAAVVDARKMKMFAVIDHSGEATNEGLGLRDTKISYTAPRALAARYRLSYDLTDRLAGMDALTDAVIKA